MPELSGKAQARQEQLQRKYLDSLPAKRSRIEAHWKQVQSSGWNGAALAALQADVHRLAGSAGSYRLHDLGEAASRLESTLRSGEASEAWRQTVGRRTRELIKLLEGTPRGEPQ